MRNKKLLAAVISILVIIAALLAGVSLVHRSPLSPLPTVSPLTSPRPTPTPIALEMTLTDMFPVKRGIPMNSGLCNVKTNNDDYNLIGAGWSFTWTPDGGPDTGNSVAMIFSHRAVKNGCPDIGASSMMLLTFNEPDDNNFAIETRRAARAFHDVERCYPDYYLVSPAPVWGLEWLYDFIAEYRSLYRRFPRLDAIGFHCYPIQVGGDIYSGCIERLNQAIEMIKWLREEGVPTQGVVINEWGPLCTHDYCIDDMERLMLRFEVDPYVIAYAIWSARYTGNEPWLPEGIQVTALFHCDRHRLTPYGMAYRDFNVRSKIILSPVMRNAPWH